MAFSFCTETYTYNQLKVCVQCINTVFGLALKNNYHDKTYVSNFPLYNPSASRMLSDFALHL